MMGQRWRCCHAARPRPRCRRWFWTHRLGPWLLRPLHAALRVRRPNVRFAHLCVHRLHRAGIHRALHFSIQSPLDSPGSDPPIPTQQSPRGASVHLPRSIFSTLLCRPSPLRQNRCKESSDELRNQTCRVLEVDWPASSRWCCVGSRRSSDSRSPPCAISTSAMERGVVAVVCNLPGVGPRTGAPEVQGREAARQKSGEREEHLQSAMSVHLSPGRVSLNCFH